MFRSFVLAAAAAAAAQSGALAEVNAAPGGSSVLNKIGAADIASMMTELGVGTELVPVEGAGPVVLATTPGGGKFVFHPMTCEDAKNSARCANVIVTTAMSSNGLAYDDLNAFNGDAVVTAAVNVPEEQMVILGRNIVVLGGHSRELFKTTVYLFLNDVAKFAAKGNSAKSVAFDPAPAAQSKISLKTLTGKLPARAFGFSDLSAEVSAAIANTNDVRFALPPQE